MFARQPIVAARVTPTSTGAGVRTTSAPPLSPLQGELGPENTHSRTPFAPSSDRGNDSPPMAPRPTGSTMLEGPTTVMQVGQTVTCRAGSWSGNPTFAYEFWEDENDTVLRRGPSPDFELREEDAGRTLYCRVLATNAGGTTFDESPDAGVPVQSPPELSVSPSTAQRGGPATLRVRLEDWTRPLGNVAVCVRFAPRIGGKVCRTAAPAGAAPVVVMKLSVKPTAPLVRARATVTARAADGRAAIGPAFVQLR